jgi:hypothetical protein
MMLAYRNPWGVSGGIEVRWMLVTSPRLSMPVICVGIVPESLGRSMVVNTP